jgi:hypothetical protein
MDLLIMLKSVFSPNGPFKGTVSREFSLLVFLHESVSPHPQSIPFGPFRIFSSGYIRKSRCTTGINDNGGKPIP